MANKNAGRQRRSRNTFVTHTGNSIKVNRSMSDRWHARRDNRARRRANRLAALPKGHLKRMLYRLQPKRLAAYWFSRDGAIMALKITGVGIVVVFVLLIGLFAYFRKDLPKLNDVTGGKLAGSITYYDRTGTQVLWQDYDAVKRVPVQGNQISQYMKDATVAIEDKNFYHEGGFSISGIARAGLHDIFGGGGGGGLQGASTIPEQVVKLNENWTGNRTIATKIKEVILAVDLSREYSKDDILTGYLNVAPYGGVDYGVEAAARDYFGEDASQLTLPQAAMLAAIPQAPSYYSPYSDPQYNPSASTDEFGQQDLITRQQYILDLMAKQHYITQEQADAAKQVDILAQIHPLQTKYAGIEDPYFVLAAKQQLENTYGAATVNRGGWKVTTTLNATLQNYAQQDVQNNERNVRSAGGDEEAMVAEDVQTGQVVAQIGGEDFTNPQYGQINYADTRLSPGSSMKPFMYAALIQNNTNVGAGSVLYDSQSPLPGYPCTDKTPPTATSNGGNCLWDDTDTYPGPETVRYALATSRNVPAVKASYEILPTDTNPYTNSINKWIGTANLAIGTPNAYACYQPGADVATATAAQQTQCYGSAAIGSGDITIADEVNGDATFARMGAQIPQTYILNITDSSGKTIYNWTQPKATQVYNPDTAYIINNILDDPRASYLPASQKFQNYNGWDIAVKTGTENQEYNGIMTAWSTKYAVVAFAGYHTLNVPLHVGLFEQITEPISRTWIDQALTALHTKPANWVQPTDIKTEKSFVETAKIDPYGEEMPSPSTDLYPTWYTPINPGASTSATIDKVSGLLATSCTPQLAQQTEGGGNDAAFSIDIFYPKTFANMKALEGGTAGTPSAQTDNVHNCSDVPPSVTLNQSLDQSNNIVCEDASHCDFTVAVTQGTDALSGGSYTTSPAGTISLIINGNTVQTQAIPAGASSPYTATFNNIPGSTTGASVEAQAVDSVLYSGTSTITVNNNFPAP